MSLHVRNLEKLENGSYRVMAFVDTKAHADELVELLTKMPVTHLHLDGDLLAFAPVLKAIEMGQTKVKNLTLFPFWNYRVRGGFDLSPVIRMIGGENCTLKVLVLSAIMLSFGLDELRLIKAALSPSSHLRRLQEIGFGSNPRLRYANKRLHTNRVLLALLAAKSGPQIKRLPIDLLRELKDYITYHSVQ